MEKIIIDFIKHFFICIITGILFLFLYLGSLKHLSLLIISYFIFPIYFIYLFIYSCILSIPTFLIKKSSILSIVIIILCIVIFFVLYSKKEYYKNLSIDMYPNHYIRENISYILWALIIFINQIMTKFYIIGYKKIKELWKKN